MDLSREGTYCLKLGLFKPRCTSTDYTPCETNGKCVGHTVNVEHVSLSFNKAHNRYVLQVLFRGSKEVVSVLEPITVTVGEGVVPVSDAVTTVIPSILSFCVYRCSYCPPRLYSDASALNPGILIFIPPLVVHLS